MDQTLQRIDGPLKTIYEQNPPRFLDENQLAEATAAFEAMDTVLERQRAAPAACSSCAMPAASPSARPIVPSSIPRCYAAH